MVPHSAGAAPPPASRPMTHPADVDPTPMLPSRAALAARVALFWAGYMVILRVGGVVQGMAPPPVRSLAWGAASAAGVLGLTLVLARNEGRSADSVGVRPSRGTAGRLLVGAAIGAGLYGLQLGIASALAGPISLEPTPGAGASAVVLGAATFLALSSMEELGFRGYALRSLHARFGLWPALATTTLAFGLSHVAFGWSLPAILLGVVPGGLLFGMSAVATRGLAVPIGLHAAWNWADWAVGRKDTPGLWTMVVDEPVRGQMATAGAFGYLAAMAVGIAGFWAWSRRRAS